MRPIAVLRGLKDPRARVAVLFVVAAGCIASVLGAAVLGRPAYAEASSVQIANTIQALGLGGVVVAPLDGPAFSAAVPAAVPPSRAAAAAVEQFGTATTPLVWRGRVSTTNAVLGLDGSPMFVVHVDGQRIHPQGKYVPGTSALPDTDALRTELIVFVDPTDGTIAFATSVR